jgi:hypothetical protein
MLVSSPFSKLGEILFDMWRIRVKDVRSIPMHQHPGTVQLVEGIAADMRTLVDDKNGSPMRRESFSNHCAGESCAHH